MNKKKTMKIIHEIQETQCEIIAVSKYQSDTDITSLIEMGIKNFGENTQQNLSKRHASFPNVNWHFIGRIQSNKIKQIVKNAHMIHSVANLRHLAKIDQEASKINKIQTILIQINLSGEITKDGIIVTELEAFLNKSQQLANVAIQGLMVIGDHSDDQDKISQTFKQAQELFNMYQKKYNLSCLSMGMSNDYPLALACGSTHLRLGSILFAD